jgi:hypothetical protein
MLAWACAPLAQDVIAAQRLNGPSARNPNARLSRLSRILRTAFERAASLKSLPD